MTFSAVNTLASISNLGHREECTSVTSDLAKIMADIDFLKDRIRQLQSHQKPNYCALETYGAMLARRELALTLLQPSRTLTPAVL